MKETIQAIIELTIAVAAGILLAGGLLEILAWANGFFMGVC